MLDTSVLAAVAAGTCAALALLVSAARADPPAPAPVPAAAAPPPAETAKPADSAAPKPPVDVVVTGTRTPENARRSPVRVDVVTRAEADRRGATNVGEALAGSLGTQVNPSAYGSLGRPSAIQIGGLDTNRVLVLEDGERVVGDKGGAIDLAQIPLSDVSRIETLTGPASALYGSSAIGGVVTVITAPPELEGPSGSARAEFRSPAGVLLIGSAAYRAAESWARADGSFARGAGIALDPSLPDLAAPAFTRGAAGLRAGTQIAPGTTLTARVRFARDSEDGLQTQPPPPGLTKRYLIDLPETSDRFSVRLREKITISPAHEVSISLAKQWFWNTSGFDRRDSPVDDLRTRFHTMHSAEATASLFSDRWLSALAGARFESESFVQSLQRTEVVGGGVRTRTLPEVPDTSLTSGALYGQLKLKLGGAWTTLGGVRLEGNSRYGAAVAPSLGVAFSPSDWLILRANVGRGYRAPSAKELGFVFDHSVYGYRVIGNTKVSPETSWGIGANAELAPSRGVRLRGGVFANWIQDLIDFQLAPPGTGPPAPAGVATFTYVNIGAARTMGATIDASVRASSWLRTEVGWAYTFTRDETLQRPLPGRPPYTVQASAYANLPYGIDLVFRARFVTDAYIDDVTRTPGFGTLDARISKTIYGNIRGYCGALNLLGAQKDPMMPSDARPVEGRIFYAGASADFPWEQ
jgi:outer membrane receptor for ferrienterochelin and colicins